LASLLAGRFRLDPRNHNGVIRFAGAGGGKHNARRGMDLDRGGLPDRQRTYELSRQSIVLGEAPVRAVCGRIDDFLAGSDPCSMSSTLGEFEWTLVCACTRNRPITSVMAIFAAATGADDRAGIGAGPSGARRCLCKRKASRCCPRSCRSWENNHSL
jgi:hypothetical protein